MASIKARLLVLVLPAVALVWIAAAAFTYFDAREEIDELLDGHLAQAASLLVAQMSHEIEEIDVEHAPALHKYSRDVAFQIWEKGRKLRLHSANAPNEPLAPARPGFATSAIGADRWRVFSSWDASGEFLIQVGERIGARDELAREIAAHLLQPLLYSLPALALLLWLAVGNGLRPLVRLTGDVARREPANLAPLDSVRVPKEVLPLIEQLNRLFARIAQSLENERRFTADAAHELRTPIAAIKAQAQVARGAAAEAEKNLVLDKVILGCDRAARLVDQLLTLAQLDRAPRALNERCRLRELAADAVAEMAPAARAAGVELSLSDGDDPEIAGNAALLTVLLRNLLDNAIRYSPAATAVRVAIGRDAGHAHLTVVDQGPGISETERDKVTERFYRVLGTGQPGAGLGLSIVKRIAELHGGELRLESGDAARGLRATVLFAR